MGHISLYVLGTKPHTNQPPHQPGQNRPASEYSDKARRARGCFALVIALAAHHPLQALCGARRKQPAGLHFRQIGIGKPPLTQGPRKNICRSDRVLDSKINAKTTNRRHGMSGIANAQHAWCPPLFETIHAD